MIGALIESRQYYVEDSGAVSTLRGQLCGISQVCALRPLLFVKAMSIVMHDAVGMLNVATSRQYTAVDLADVLYAEDALLIGVTEHCLDQYLRAVYEAGKRYGMELHFGKFQMITTSRSPVTVRTPGGTDIHSKASMEYLGSILQGSGQVDHEINRRVAIARADFDAIAKTWTHSSLTWRQNSAFSRVWSNRSCCMQWQA